MENKMDICVDFDGTCVTHEFPEIGEDIGAAPVLKKIQEANHNIILFTMRSNSEERNCLDEACQWFDKNGIDLFGINTNPTQYKWTSSPKAYGHLYIDDAALGVPLIYPMNKKRPYVDWIEVRRHLIIMNVLR
jgi:hypothetical protein